MSDHQLVFPTGKISKFKAGGVHKCIKFRSLKNYRVHDFKKSIGQLVFPNYNIFGDVNMAYSDFSQKFMAVIVKVALFKTKRVKGNTQNWFNGEVSERLNSKDKLFQKFLKV